MSGTDNPQIDKNITSTNGQESLNVETQKDLVSEFMKILSLAHMCEVEAFTDKNGVKQKFYNGPSPDEVALV